MKQYAAIDETVYFWFAGNDTSGSGGDGASPAADVRLAGAAADAAPVYSPTPVLLSNAGYPAGAYEVAIVASAGNGFAADNTYAVFCTLAIDAQNPTGFVGSFDTMPVQANAIEVEGADPTDTIRDAVVDDATRIDASALNTLSGHDPGATIAKAGDLMGLANDAITSAKYDESTAFPLSAVDGSGLSAVPWNGSWDAEVQSEVNDALVAFFTSAAQLVDDIWDEELTGATHNIATSAGRRVREIGAYAIHSGTAQGGNSIHITLAATASATDGIYNRNLLVIVGGTGAGQTRTIVDFNGTTKVALADREWRVSPDATSEYQIVPDDTPLVADHGLATAGTANTITLRSYASAVDNVYNGAIITIIAGTGRGESGIVDSYVGSTKVATTCENWNVAPDNTSVYVMMPFGRAAVACISAAALADIKTQADDALTDYGFNDITVADIIAGVADGSYDLQEMMRIIFSACALKSAGGGTATITMRDSGDAKDRITATVDGNGNRTAVTLDVS